MISLPDEPALWYNMRKNTRAIFYKTVGQRWLSTEKGPTRKCFFLCPIHPQTRQISNLHLRPLICRSSWLTPPPWAALTGRWKRFWELNEGLRCTGWSQPAATKHQEDWGWPGSVWQTISWTRQIRQTPSNNKGQSRPYFLMRFWSCAV